MDYFAGLDVSVKETSVCIVDDAGKIVREARVASEPEALLQVLTTAAGRTRLPNDVNDSEPDAGAFANQRHSLACKNAPTRAIAVRASGRMRANICQT